MPIWIQGWGQDLPAGATWIQQILLSSMINDSPQPAGASLPYPFVAAMFYRHDEASADPENPPLPMVRIDDDLQEVDQPPAGDYRVVYYVTEGGLSDRPERTGQEVQRLELPLASNAYGTADLALAFWHLDCQAGASPQRIEMHPMRWLAYLYQPFQITSSSGPCVNQGDLTAVDCVSGDTIELMPFSPATFCLKAITSDGSTAPYTVKLVSYDENGFPIAQDNPIDPDWPYEIPVTLLYNSTLGYHLSAELEAQLPGAGGSGLSSLFLPLSVQILQQQTQGVLDFFISEIGSLLAGAI